MNFREEFYLNFIQDDRWRYITRGLGTTFTVTFFAVILGVALGIVIALIRSTADKSGSHNIFQDVEGLQNNIERVTSHIRQLLTEAGETDVERKVLRVVPTKDGKLYYQTPEGDYWRVYVLIENALSYERIDPHSAYLAGQAFGHFQCQLSTDRKSVV